MSQIIRFFQVTLDLANFKNSICLKTLNIKIIYLYYHINFYTSYIKYLQINGNIIVIYQLFNTSLSKLRQNTSPLIPLHIGKTYLQLLHYYIAIALFSLMPLDSYSHLLEMAFAYAWAFQVTTYLSSIMLQSFKIKQNVGGQMFV